jgi:hypothetical protein
MGGLDRAPPAPRMFEAAPAEPGRSSVIGETGCGDRAYGYARVAAETASAMARAAAIGSGAAVMGRPTTR